MASEIEKQEQSAPETDAGVKRRGLLRFGTLITAFTGASAISALGANSAQAAPGNKNPPADYVPIEEKGAASGVATLDIESKIPVTQVPDLSAAYASMGSVNARAHLVTATGVGATDLTDLQSAVSTAATAGAPLMMRGNFILQGGTVAPVSEIHIDASNASFTQTDNLRPTFNMPAGSSIRGGKIIGKGRDWVNTSDVYAACGVQVSTNGVTIDGLTVQNMAGAGVYAPIAISGLRVLDCFFTGLGSAVIPANTGQFSGGVVFGNNNVTNFTLRGGRYRDFAQGIVAGNVANFFIGGGLEVSAAGQHGLYLGAVNGGSVSGLRVNFVPLQGIKAQLNNASTDGQLFTIGDTLIRGNGSHGVLLTNVDDSPTSFNRRTVVHDVVVEHAAGGGGDGVAMQGVKNVIVHDVIGYGGRRGLRAVDGAQLNIHHNDFGGYNRSGMSLTNVVDSEINFNNLRDGSNANDANDEFGYFVAGAGSANLRFANNRISDAAANTRYAFYISAGDLTTMSFTNNTATGMSDYGFRSAVTTSTNIWAGNDLVGTRGKFFNMPTNAAPIADTSGATLASLETEVNKLKERMRGYGVVS